MQPYFQQGSRWRDAADFFLLNKLIKLGNFECRRINYVRTWVHVSLHCWPSNTSRKGHRGGTGTSNCYPTMFSAHFTYPNLWFASCCAEVVVSLLFVKFHADLFLHLQNVNRLLAVVRFVCVYISYIKITGWKIRRRWGPKTGPRWLVHIEIFSSRNLRTLHLKWGGAPSCGHTKLRSPWCCLISGIAHLCIRLL